MDYVFRLEKGYFGEEEGGHGRAPWHGVAVLRFDFRNSGKTMWHGGTVLLLWSSGLGFAGLCCFWCFYILAFWDVLGCDVGVQSFATSLTS